TLAVAVAGFTDAGNAQALDRWKHPQARTGAPLVGGLPRGQGSRPVLNPALEPNRDAAAPGLNEPRTGEPRRDLIGGNPNEPRLNEGRLPEGARLNPNLQGPGTGMQGGIRRPGFGSAFARAGAPGQFRPGAFARSPLARGPFAPGLQG